MQKRIIGIFDSGFGGLTVMKEVVKALPYEDIIYFGDTAHVPYGSKSKESVKRFSINIAEFLLEHNIGLLIVACNTASSFALNLLKKRLPVPVIGVVEPGVKAACNYTVSKHIGIIGTAGTIQSNAYQRGLMKCNKKLKIYSKACPLFVPLVEEGWTKNKISIDIAKEYLMPLKRSKIDTLILGCTHYPLLKKVIKQIMGKNVVIIDSAQETSISALDNKEPLKKRKPEYKFFVTDDCKKFKKLGKKILGRPITKVKKVVLE
ncbi:glutamate racemase [bacterium]